MRLAIASQPQPAEQLRRTSARCAVNARSSPDLVAATGGHWFGGRNRSGNSRHSTELAHELLVGIEIREHDHLADFGILVSIAARGSEAAPPASAAARAPADVRLARISLGQGFLFGRARVHQRKRHIGFALFDVDASSNSPDGTAPAAKVTEQTADCRARTAATRILVCAHDIWLQKIIRSL